MAEIGELITTCNGRLTLTSGVPVTTSDVTAATTVYFTPYLGDHIALWNGEAWIFHQFEELSLSLSGYTADTNYDIWMYNNAGVLALESTAWASATARATALATLNGIYVKSGDALRRYLGTIRTTSTTGQCEDRIRSRFVWNYYNRVQKFVMANTPSASTYTYGSATVRPMNNLTTIKIELVNGVQEDTTSVRNSCELRMDNTEWGYIGIGYDTTSSMSQTLQDVPHNDNTGGPIRLSSYTHFIGAVGIGYHYLIGTEYVGQGTISFEPYGGARLQGLYRC